MAETTNKNTDTKEYEVRCADCGDLFDADIPLEALQPQTEDANAFTVDCPECEAENIIVYDPEKDAVGLTCADEDDADDDDDEDDEDEREDDEDEDEEEDEN